MAKVNLLTQKEYAKHRGCSPAAVCKAVKENRISLIDGKIDPVVADIQWDANTRARTANVNRGAVGVPLGEQLGPVVAPPPAEPAHSEAAHGEAAPTPGRDGQLPLQGDSGDPADTGGAAPGDLRYQTSRASREEASARREWNRVLEEEGQLVRIDQVRAALAERLAPVREAFMQMPARLAPLLAADQDAASIQNLLESSIHEILGRLGTP